MRKYVKVRRGLAVLLIFFLLSSGSPCHILAAGKRALTLEESVRIGISNSGDVEALEMEKFKTRIELYQAKEALADLRKKEKTVRFSLLLNIKLPETHAQPKEISTVFKIPELVAKIIDFDKKISEAKSKLTMDIRLQYLTVVSESINEENTGIKLKEAEEALQMLQEKFRIGQATKEALKAGEDDVKALKKALQQAVMSCEKEKKSLGSLIGMNVGIGYDFDSKLINVNIDRDILKELLDNTLKNDMEIYEARRKLAMAQLKTEILMMDTRKKFGSMASPVEQALRTPGKVDYNNLLVQYEQMLDRIQDKYGGNYYIPFIFFVIPIPKEWFQREFDGIRYFDNEKFALPLSVTEREKEAANVEKITQQETKKVETLYLNLVSAQIAFADAKAKSEELLKEYEEAIGQNKLGILTYEALNEKKKSLRTVMESAIANLVGLDKQIYMLSYESSGALEKYIGKTSITLQALQNGESFVNSTGGEEGKKEEAKAAGDWYIDPRLDDYKVAFGIRKLPEGVKATHYELLTYEGERIGQRCKIEEEIVHLPLLFNESAMLRVKLYDEDKLVAEAELDGFETGGTLVVHPPANQNVFSGTWEVQKVENTYKSALKIKVDEALGASHYQVLWKDEPVSVRLPLDKEAEHLDVVFNTPAELTIRLFKQEEEIAKAFLKESDTGERTLDIVVGK